MTDGRESARHDARSDAEPDGRDTGPDPGPDALAGRRRFRRALTRPGRGQVVVAVLLALVGFAGVTQVHSTQSDSAYASYREDELVEVLAGLTATQERYQNDISDLEETRDRLQTGTSARQAALDEASQRADTLSILAGLVPAHGPGVRVTIDDPNAAVTIDILLDAVQEFRASGAEAMEFNDQVRAIAQTSFEDGVGGIKVDGQLITPPYVIDVIGEPSALEDAIDFPGGPRSDVEQDAGGTVTTQVLDRVDVQSVVEKRQPANAPPEE